MKDYKQHQMFLRISNILGEQSSCISTKVGCVIVKDGRIISSGHNDTPEGHQKCNEWWERTQDHEYVKLNPQDRKKHVHYQTNNQVHAQMDAILFAAKNGISIQGSTIYVNYFPCTNCLKHIAQSGIENLYFVNDCSPIYFDKELYEQVKQNIHIEKIKMKF